MDPVFIERNGSLLGRGNMDLVFIVRNGSLLGRDEEGSGFTRLGFFGLRMRVC